MMSIQLYICNLIHTFMIVTNFTAPWGVMAPALRKFGLEYESYLFFEYFKFQLLKHTEERV
jgi:hypothetical protein